jgi:hypothetical protein
MIIDRPDDPLNYVQPGTVDTAVPGWSTALAQALQTASKSSLAQQPASTPLAAVPIPKGTPGSPGRPLGLDALVRLLQQRQAQYGTPVAQPRSLGLLGF